MLYFLEVTFDLSVHHSNVKRYQLVVDVEKAMIMIGILFIRDLVSVEFIPARLSRLTTVTVFTQKFMILMRCKAYSNIG